jgi:hypothetical protein
MYSPIRKKSIGDSSCKSPTKLLSTCSAMHTGQSFMLPAIASCRSVGKRKDSRLFFLNSEADKSFQRCQKYFKEKSDYTHKIKALRMQIQANQRLKKLQEREKYGFKGQSDGANRFFHDKNSESAVRIIERWWKRVIITRKLKENERILCRSAIKIQRNWRKHAISIKIAEENKKKEKAAIVIQKLYRGYIVRRKYALLLKEKKMHKVFEYFTSKKNKLMNESAKVIKHHWQKYSLKKKARQNKLKSSITIREKSLSFDAELEFDEKEKNRNSASPTKGLGKRSNGLLEPPVVIQNRLRSLTEANCGLETIKEVREK